MSNHGNTLLNPFLSNEGFINPSWCGLLEKGNKEVSYEGYRRIKLPLPEGEGVLQWPVSKIPYTIKSLGIFSSEESGELLFTINLKDKVTIKEKSVPSFNLYKFIKRHYCEDYQSIL